MLPYAWVLAIGLLLARAAHGQPVLTAEPSSATAAGGSEEPQLRTCLVWDPGPSRECPGLEAMQSAIADVLGRPFVSRGKCETTAMGAIRSEAGGGWRVDIQFTGRDGESLGDRSLEAPEGACAALTEPLSFVIALMVEGNQTEKGPLHLSSIVTRRATARAGSGYTPSVSVGGAVASGLLRGIGFGVTVGVASRAIARLPLRAETTFWLPSGPSSSGPDGQFWAWEGGLGFCPSVVHSRHFAVSACLEAVAAAIRGVGLGLTEARTSTKPFAAGKASVTMTARLSRQVSAYVTAGAEVSWLRSRFVYYEEPAGAPVPVHEPHAFIPVGSFGVELWPPETSVEGGRP